MGFSWDLVWDFGGGQAREYHFVEGKTKPGDLPGAPDIPFMTLDDGTISPAESSDYGIKHLCPLWHFLPALNDETGMTDLLQLVLAKGTQNIKFL